MKLKLKKPFLFTAVCAVILSAGVYMCPRMQLKAAADNAGGSYYLPVFETSDIHGSIAAESEDGTFYLLACISDKVRDVRGYGEEERKDRAVLLDGGDIYQGNVLSGLLEGEPVSAAFAAMGYDAVTIGNHEFDWGIETTVDADGTMRDYAMGGLPAVNDIPVVISNLYRYGEPADFAEEYVILEKTAVDENDSEIPVRIGVIGFAGEYSSSIRYDNFTGAGFSINPDCSKVNVLASELEESGQCDATILLVHEDAFLTAYDLGEDSAIDLVLGGHTHQSVNGITPWDLRYMQPSGNGTAYVYAELEFQLQDGTPVFQQVINAKTIPTAADGYGDLTDDPENAENLDPELVALTDEVIEGVSELLDLQIGYITESLQRYEYLPGSGERATTCGNWMASIIARIADADVGFINVGGLRKDLRVGKNKGQRWLTLSDVYTMFPFNNRIFCFEITYEELLTALSYSLTGSGASLLSQMVGIDCYYTDQTVNAIITSDGQEVYVNGEWKEGWKEKTLRVAMNEFSAATDRKDGDMSNPFCAWCETDRLIRNDQIDSEGAFAVLTAEAAFSSGYLFVDTTPHYINSEYK